MWLASMAQLLVLAATGSPDVAAKLSEPIATRQTVFSIPFRIDRPLRPSREPVEVRLYVSTDRGESWRVYERTDPAAGACFVFRAPGDGQYWFMVRTLDRSDRLWPQKPNLPELRVVVDTVPPKLDLHARGGQGGQIIAKWQINEPHLKPESLKIQYRAAPGGQWQSVATNGSASLGHTGLHSDEATWWPPAGASALEIRAEVVDLAGNLAVSHDRVELHARPRDGPNRASASSPEIAEATEQRSADWLPASADSSYSGWVAAGGVGPAVGNRYAPAVKATSGAAGGLPAGIRPRMVNSRIFRLEYDEHAAASAEVRCVELWGTRDGGQHWSPFGLDDDNRSPLRVSVNEEGLYGFRIVVQQAQAAVSRPPSPGETPDVWVCVDLAKPTARITAVTQGTGDQAGQLIIRWEASDANLASRPVRISFSESPHGPWSTIASALENTGVWGWSLGGWIPESAYLRLEVFDTAENVGVFETSAAVSLDRFLRGATARRPRLPAHPMR